MILSRFARRYYRVTVTTDPQVTDWEASFDNGATWVAGTPIVGVDNGYQWLVAGPDVDLGAAVAVISANVTPLLRDVDTAEVLVEDAPRIWLE